jgi:cytoskeleton protein RodZ
MNSSEINESDSQAAEPARAESEKAIFGDVLLRAREAKAYSIIEVAKATHLSEAVIDAIEQSDLTRLPPPTFVQGYLRTYARYLELPEQQIVDSFNRAVPYKRESQLQPRATLPSQATSASPLIRGVSILLVFLAVLTLVYSAYSYYARTAKSIGLEQADPLEFNLQPGEAANSEQHTVISEDGELIVVALARNVNAEAETPSKATTSMENVQPDAVKPAVSEPVSAVKSAPVSSEAAIGSDVIELQANDDSWVEIVDASSLSLYHDLLGNGLAVRLQGEAPFDVFLGNAPGVRLQVNGVEVNMNRYIRTNNVARFSVSTRDGNAVFR